METHRPDLMYLSTTDYIQHKAGPGTKIANDFYAMIDGYLDQLDKLGAVVVATADHGMNDKHKADKSPDVIYLQTLFDGWLGKGQARVILPITDPYVAHHGALGGFATVHVPADADDAELIGEAARHRGRRAGREQGRGLRALRAAGRPHRRHRRHLDAPQGAGHGGRAARPVGARRAAALARRACRSSACR